MHKIVSNDFTTSSENNMASMTLPLNLLTIKRIIRLILLCESFYCEGVLRLIV